MHLYSAFCVLLYTQSALQSCGGSLLNHHQCCSPVVASYETTLALATLPSPEVGMAPRYTSSKYHSAVSPLPQPLDGPCLSTGRGAPRTSVPAYCCHKRYLQHGLGRYMQRAGSLGALDGGPDCFGTSTA